MISQFLIKRMILASSNPVIRIISNMSSQMKIGTHSGIFHCDEVLGCYMLKLLPQYKNATILRTRDLKLLETCDIVVDIGGEYNHSKRRYDHHQRNFEETAKSVINEPGYEWTIKLSSAGLIYCHYGREIIKQVVPEINNDNEINAIFKKVYDDLIQEIDAIDNGIPMFDAEPRYHIVTNLSSRVRALNPPWNIEKMDFEQQFYKAIALVGAEFEEFVTYAARIWLPARKLVKDAIQERFEVDLSGEIVELKRHLPWTEHMYDLEEELQIEPNIKFVIFGENESFRIQMVPIKLGSFVGRIFLPKEWAGLRDEELEKVSGIEDCIFVHSARFIGGNKSREGVLEMARKALRIGKNIEE